jgi:putative membrane protein
MSNMRIILKLLITAAAVWAADYFIDGIDFDGSFWALLLLALIFGLVNTFIKPILKLLSFPIVIVTFGLFVLIINAAMLALTAAISDSLSIDNFWSALLGALVISVVSTVLNWFVPND